MAPSNPTLSEGRNGCGSGEYRRRAHPHCSHGHGKPSDAVAAAEAAASYILSDGPIRSKKSFARNRSGSGGGNANGGNANGGNVGSGNGPNSNGGGSNNSGNGGRSFLLRMHNQRERLMQRQKNRDFLTPLKTTAWILLFALVGAIFMYEGEQLHRERDLRQNGGDGAQNDPAGKLVSVPLPPNVERKYEKDRTVAQSVRGAHHKRSQDDVPPDIKNGKDGVVNPSVRGRHSKNEKQRDDAPGKQYMESREVEDDDAPRKQSYKNKNWGGDVPGKRSTKPKEAGDDANDAPERSHAEAESLLKGEGHRRRHRDDVDLPEKQPTERELVPEAISVKDDAHSAQETSHRHHDVVPPDIERKNGKDGLAGQSRHGGHSKNKKQQNDAPGKHSTELEKVEDGGRISPETGRTGSESVRQGRREENRESKNEKRGQIGNKKRGGNVSGKQSAESKEPGDDAKNAPETSRAELESGRRGHREKKRDDVESESPRGGHREKNRDDVDVSKERSHAELESPRKGEGHREGHRGDVDTRKERTTEMEAATKEVSMKDDARGGRDTNHHHAIPPILIFTYHTNLLTTPESDLKDEEDAALAQNVKQIISYHPGSSVRFLNDEQCLESIRVALGPKTNLTKYFTQETHGMYKADICRGAALYETGGLYFDIDIEARMPLWDAIAPTTEFVTTLVHKDSNHHGGFFQAFIGVTPRHPIMKRYLELFVEYYEGRVEVKGPLGVYFLRMAYDDAGHDEAVADLWQEVRYHPKLFPELKRDHWGERRACQMLVVAPERKGSGGKVEREAMVPLFSHANGSRMCGGKDTHRRGGTG